MSWKHIKTVLIFLFLIINIYLIYSSTPGNINNTSKTVFDTETINKTSEIVKNNFDITVDAALIPRTLTNLKYINSTNIIYTEEFERSDYNFHLEKGAFSADVKTDTYSYNESTATGEIKKFLRNLGIKEDSYQLNFSKSDEGLVCTVNEKLSQYSVFNGRIVAVFHSSAMHVRGRWYIPESHDMKSNNSALKMIPISGVIVDAAQKMSLELTGRKITDIQYGYYVSYYDENTVSKSASAIPCYMIKTDSDYKYYYDAINGKSLKQEE